MTFKQFAKMLEEDLGVEIEMEGDACAFSLGSKEGDNLSLLLQGFDERGMVLTCADLGEPPPEGREQLFRALLEANDLYGDTAGATLSLNRQTGQIRLQRYDDMDALANVGAAKALIAFSDTAAAWQRLIADFRSGPANGPDDASVPSGMMMV